MNLGDLGNLLQQYAGGTGAAPARDVNADFDEVASAVPPEALSHGIAEAFRSDQTPSFGQSVSQLFGQSSGEQRAGLLNHLISSVGPGVLSALGRGGLLSGLTGLLEGAQGQITPDQAQNFPPETVQQLADHAEKQNPSVVDSVSRFYAQHPGLVKTLGGTAILIAISKIAQRQFPNR